MRQFITIVLLILLPLCAKADNSQLYQKLDAALAKRAHYVEVKEKSLHDIKQGAKYVTSDEDKLKLYEQLANGYKAYEYDSAMTYLKKGLVLAQKSNNILYHKRFQLSQTSLLITRGFYAEAKEMLQKIETKEDDPRDYQFQYYHTLYGLYNYWSTYCENNNFSKDYDQLKVKYLKKAIELSPKKDAFYYYLLGESYYFSNNPNNNKTIQYYKKALSMEKPDSRLHAMTAFALSELYKRTNNPELMEHYLLVAAISDITSATKENVALQDIALFIYKHKTRSLKKAQEYINISLEDAYAYNNRLRRIEISSKLQMITNAYTDDIRTTNSLLYIALSVIFLLSLGVGLSSLFIRKKNKLLKQKKDEITATSAKMEVLNSQLHLINEELKDTNQKRERLVKVYIDLCYKNIERNSKLRTLAVRKIKANQSKGAAEPPFFLNQYREREQGVSDGIRQGIPVSVPNFYNRAEQAAYRIGTHPAERERRNAPYPPCVRPVKIRHHRKFQDSRHPVLFAPNRIQLPLHAQEQCHRQGALRRKRTQTLHGYR